MKSGIKNDIVMSTANFKGISAINATNRSHSNNATVTELNEMSETEMSDTQL